MNQFNITFTSTEPLWNQILPKVIEASQPWIKDKNLNQAAGIILGKLRRIVDIFGFGGRYTITFFESIKEIRMENSDDNVIFSIKVEPVKTRIEKSFRRMRDGEFLEGFCLASKDDGLSFIRTNDYHTQGHPINHQTAWYKNTVSFWKLE